ncbi:LacI family DNA-binding transcriptional regulator [Microlunatus soli]|uniref:Transcriptional regulator, LacI family n=1 Tax=Microlunatus soli TaxID=630515 RepID=A0A1H1TBA0_9ACTN|nr:LacI family DNA-binding transcriptional regulator [Microlunatus soli]SDS57428.1 transcriptional regulator, LacI family [Microlunatus soli]
MATRSDRSTPARLRDVAQRAGVSPGLASRVLNNDASVRLRPETKQAVITAAAELDYVPNSAARSLRYARTSTLGMVIESVTSPMYDGIVHGAQEAAATHGFFILMIDAHEVERRPALFAELIAARRIDGLLLQGGFDASTPIPLDRISAIPAVLLNAHGVGSIPGAVLQDEEAADLATRHLLDLGHRDLLFVGSPQGSTSERRRHGFDRAVERHPDATGRMLAAGWSAERCHDAVVEHLATGARPSGIIAVNAETAVGVLSAVHESGLSVPDDLSVVAIHDSWFTEHLRPPLTTVALPMRKLGALAVERLLEQMREPHENDLVITDPAPSLTVRSSTGQPPR